LHYLTGKNVKSTQIELFDQISTAVYSFIRAHIGSCINVETDRVWVSVTLDWCN